MFLTELLLCTVAHTLAITALQIGHESPREASAKSHFRKGRFVTVWRKVCYGMQDGQSEALPKPLFHACKGGVKDLPVFLAI